MLRATSCVCDLSCCVYVTYLGNAATGLFFVTIFYSGNTSYTIGVILCWSKVNSCRRAQPQKLRRVHCRVQDNLPFAKWIFSHQVLPISINIILLSAPSLTLPIFSNNFFYSCRVLHACCMSCIHQSSLLLIIIIGQRCKLWNSSVVFLISHVPSMMQNSIYQPNLTCV